MAEKQSQSVDFICLTPVKKRAHESLLWSKVTTGWGEEEGATEDIFFFKATSKTELSWELSLCQSRDGGGREG